MTRNLFCAINKLFWPNTKDYTGREDQILLKNLRKGRGNPISGISSSKSHTGRRQTGRVPSFNTNGVYKIRRFLLCNHRDGQGPHIWHPMHAPHHADLPPRTNGRHEATKNICSRGRCNARSRKQLKRPVPACTFHRPSSYQSIALWLYWYITGRAGQNTTNDTKSFLRHQQTLLTKHKGLHWTRGSNLAQKSPQRQRHLEHVESSPWMGDWHRQGSPHHPKRTQEKSTSPYQQHPPQHQPMILVALKKTYRHPKYHRPHHSSGDRNVHLPSTCAQNSQGSPDKPVRSGPCWTDLMAPYGCIISRQTNAPKRYNRRSITMTRSEERHGYGTCVP